MIPMLPSCQSPWKYVHVFDHPLPIAKSTPPGEWISSTPVCHDPRGCTLRQRNLQSQQRARQLPIKSPGSSVYLRVPVVHAFCRHRIRASLGDYTTVLTAWICSLISFARYETLGSINIVSWWPGISRTVNSPVRTSFHPSAESAISPEICFRHETEPPGRCRRAAHIVSVLGHAQSREPRACVPYLVVPRVLAPPAVYCDCSSRQQRSLIRLPLSTMWFTPR